MQLVDKDFPFTRKQMIPATKSNVAGRFICAAMNGNPLSSGSGFAGGFDTQPRKAAPIYLQREESHEHC